MKKIFVFSILLCLQHNHLNAAMKDHVVINSWLSNKQSQSKKRSRPEDNKIDIPKRQKLENTQPKHLADPQQESKIVKKNKRSEYKKPRKICLMCNKSLVSSSALKDHMMLHTGERPYKCNTCDKGFIQKCNLSRHVCLKKY